MPDSQTPTARCHARWDTRHRHLDHHRGIKVQVIQIFSPKTSRAAVGRVSLMTPFAFVWEGTNSTHKVGLQGQEHVSGSLLHIILCHWHMPVPEPCQSSTQMPALSLTTATKKLSQSPHGSYFGLSPVPYCSGNSSCLLHLTYVPVAGQDFPESLTTNCSNRCASPWDSRVTSCLPHATKLRLHQTPPPWHLPSSDPQSRASAAGPS